MNKHIFPIIGFLCLIIVILLFVYEYFQKGIFIGDGWLYLFLMVLVFMINIPYWKYYLKNNISLFIIRCFNLGFLNFNSFFNLNRSQD